MRRHAWISWTITGLMAALMLLSAVPDVLRVPGALAIFKHLGYPSYLLLFLGTAKMLGVAAVLVPGLPRIKEWAFAGLTFDVSGALYSPSREASGSLRRTPEYAHGVSGVLKNALDWVVGSGELIDRPIGLVNAPPRATHAHAALWETLTVMSGRIIAGASIVIPVPNGARAEDLAADVEVSAILRAVVNALADAIGDARVVSS